MTASRQPLILGLTMLLTSCAVGPNFKKAAAPAVHGYTAIPVSTTGSSTNVAGGEAQRFVTGQDIAGDWWTLFHSKPLNSLIERSLMANPNLRAAQAALVVARENVKAQRGSYYPSVTGSFSAARQKTANVLAPVPNDNDLYFNLFTPQVTVSYVPDVFGLNRRTVESLNAQAEQARFAWVASDIALSANVVAAAIQEASLREQIQATHHLIEINTNMLGILSTQFAKGYASRLDVAAQESQLAQIVATLPPLLKQLAQQRDLLAALSGGFPSEGPPEKFEISTLQLPQELPLTLPSQLVAQRPDVRQAEENMHAASAQIGIAVANRLPNFMLSADAGSMALEAGQMFSSGTGFWTLAGSVAQPIFQGGTLIHHERAAKAAFTNAAEQYRGAVITAFQNVADTLAALEQDADGLNAAAAARDAAKITLDLSMQQWRSGYASYLALLSAEQAYNQAVINLIQAQANRFADTAALFQALGGGWWNRADLTRK
ncbi:MAG TPA: efflux transporter outer membrane subunit [Verrucomicrobiae bacterium]|jgi:NodT family efflux transporter outer membrane factor (OMF) lipoprotein|nr:efflux transporter outer membrane subunit [Verrucomicrobiae bacterium]